MKNMLVIVCTLGTASAAVAKPAVEFTAHEDRVEVTVEGAGQPVSGLVDYSDRIEVLLNTDQQARSYKKRVADKTVKRLAIRERPLRLSIQLRHGRLATQKIAANTQILPTDTGFRVVIPREASTRAASKAEVENKAGEPAAKPEKSEESVVPAPVNPPAEPREPSAKGETESKQEQASAAVVPADETLKFDDAPLPKAEAASDTGMTPSWLMAVVLLLVGGGGLVWFSKKRKTPGVSSREIDVLASKVLGPKAKVVWLNAGTRNLVVAVAGNNVRVLSQWKAQEKRKVRRTLRNFAGAPSAEGSGLLRPPSAAEAHQRDAEDTSPAVAGILKLRSKTPLVSDHVATDDIDADAIWARELLEATGRLG